MAIDLLLLLFMGRGLTFYFDDWDFVTHDYGGGLHSLLTPHVGNISVFPIAVYKVLFHLVGLDHYWVFRLVVIALHLVAVGLVYILASRHAAPVFALLATCLIMFLGAAWEDLLWPFQIGYLLSIVGGLAGWVLLERRTRSADLLALIALVVSIGSSSLGIPVVVGAAVELAWRREWRRAWIVAVPALLYIIWYLQYGESQVTTNSLIDAPGFAADLAANATGAIFGHGLEWGRPLAVVGLLILAHRLLWDTPISARLAGLITTGLALWIVIAVARSTTSPVEASRYVYFGAAIIVLLAVELLQGIPASPRSAALAAVAVLVSVITGLTFLHNGALDLRGISRPVAAELGALELGAAHAAPGFQPDPVRAPQITAGPYLHTVRAIGSSPADSPSQIAAADPGSRAAADSILLTLDAPALRAVPNTRRLPSAPPPEVSSVNAGEQLRRDGCVRFIPLGAESSIVVRARPGTQLVLHAGLGGPVKLALRRFAEAFATAAVVTPGAAHSGVLTLPSDRARTYPWFVQFTAAQPIDVCSQ